MNWGILGGVAAWWGKRQRKKQNTAARAKAKRLLGVESLERRNLLSIQTLYFCPGGNPNGTYGVWDTAVANWNTSPSGGSTTQTTWQNGDIADFAGASGGTATIDTSSVIWASGIVYTANGFTIAASQQSYTLNVPSGGTTVTLANGVSGGITANITGSGALNVSGSGGLSLSGSDNDSAGGLTINSGAVYANGNGALPNGTVTVNSPGQLVANAQQTIGLLNGNSGASVVLNNGLTVNGGTFGGSMSGSGGLTVASGTLTLTGSISYGAGATVDTGATLQFGNGSSSGGISGGGPITDNGDLVFCPGSAMTLYSSISGSNSGVITIGCSSGGSVALWGGNSSFLGTTILNSGTLDIDSATALGSGGTLIVNGGAIGNTSSSSVTVSNAQKWSGNFTYTGPEPLKFTGTVTGASACQVSVNGTTVTLGGQLDINGNLSVTGISGGTLALGNGQNLYGQLTVTGAVLQSLVPGALPNGAVVNVSGNNGQLALYAPRFWAACLAVLPAGSCCITRSNSPSTLPTYRTPFQGTSATPAGAAWAAWRFPAAHWFSRARTPIRGRH